MKKKKCPVCKEAVETTNKGRLKPHLRWNWAGWPIRSTGAGPSGMHEVSCAGAQTQ